VGRGAAHLPAAGDEHLEDLSGVAERRRRRHVPGRSGAPGPGGRCSRDLGGGRGPRGGGRGGVLRLRRGAGPAGPR
jgi:hypothetical protein